MTRFLSFSFALLLLFSAATNAQRLTGTDLATLQQMDDSLGQYGAQILDDALPADRLRADSMFTRVLVRAMKIPFSYYYHFDSMLTAPVLYPEDSTFRIITWHYTLNDADYHQRGVIQMNTPDGSLKIFPLYDFSDSTDAPQDSIRTPKNWIGAVYYNLVQQSTIDGKPVYTLLGYDENDLQTTRKWIEILSFNRAGEPRFGGNIIMPSNGVRAGSAGLQRFVMEYKKGASARLNYDPDEKLIIMDHLLSESNQPDRKSTLVPGGDYEAFKWANGSWVNEPKLFTQMLGDGNEPKPATIFDDNGVADESKLLEQSEKNMKKNKPTEKTSAKPVKKKDN